MVCPRCIRTVEKILGKLGIGYRSIILGQVELERELADKEREALRKELADEGFELIDDIQSTKVEAIRLAIIQWARMSGERPSLTDFLQDKMLKEYSAISKLFSQMNSISVERYAILQRIEYAKALVSKEKFVSSL